MYKFYILVFDPTRIQMSKEIHEVIKKSQFIYTWWHYLNSAYIIKSQYTLETLHDELTKKLTNKQFLIIEIDPYNRNGWLKKEAWDWINKYR
jgi:hypothetical protein